MPPKELGMFDWDDTIIKHAKVAYDRSAIDSVRHMGITAADLSDDSVIERVNPKWGSRHEVYLTEAVKGFDVSPKDKEESFEYFLECLSKRFADHVVIVPGAVDMLEELKKGGVKLGLTTAAPRDLLVNQVWPQLNFPGQELFDEVITAYDLSDPQQAKPSPYTLNAIMSRLRIAPPNAVMVGDGPNDYLAAKAASVDFIGVETGVLNEQSARALGVKIIVANVAEIVPFVERFDKASRDSYGNASLFAEKPEKPIVH